MQRSRAKHFLQLDFPGFFEALDGPASAPGWDRDAPAIVGDLVAFARSVLAERASGLADDVVAAEVRLDALLRPAVVVGQLRGRRRRLAVL
jgi:hypothetical protein